MLLIDLHTHSHYSDGVPRIEQIETKCRQDSLAAVVTDHNEIRGAIELWERDRVPALPAVEVGTQEGLEFLIYFPRPETLEEFYRKSVEPGLRPRFMVRSRIRSVACLEHAKELGGFVSLAHPFAFGRKSLNYHKHREGSYRAFIHDVFTHIDGIEHHNAGISSSANALAEGLHLDLDKKITVGSDAHVLQAIGSAGVAITGGMQMRSEQLFEELVGNDFHYCKTDAQTSITKTLPIIMYKHTMFFLFKGNQYSRRAPVLATS